MFKFKPTALLLLPLLSGCSSLSYYTQATLGHLRLISQRQPVAELLADPATPAALKAELHLSQSVKQFAHQQLHLPDNGSYTTFVALNESAVVWNVVATRPDSLQPLPSCLLWIGCISYRGYFHRADADRYAATLQQQGYEVAVSGATAYSTLGWFSDPLLSTLFHRGEDRIVEVIIHELAHQQLYLKGDTRFNESFASTVAEIGLELWYQQPSQQQASESVQRYRQRQQRQSAFNRLLLQSRSELERLYQQPHPDPEPFTAAKAAIFADLKARYQQLKQQWQGYSGYDRWMEQPLNNAHLALVAEYQQWVPAFRAIWAASGGSLPHFYQAAADLAQQPAAVRQQRMNHSEPPHE